MLKPMGDRVLVRPTHEDGHRASGLIIPVTAQERPQMGIVVSAGEGTLVKGIRVPLEVTDGDEVLYSKYGGTEIQLDGEELIMLRESDVLAKVV